MKFEEFELDFTHDRRKFKAACQKAVIKSISPNPQIRVAVLEEDKEQPDVYIFYANNKESKVEWYQGNTNYERFATSIAKALNEKFWPGSSPAKKRKVRQ